MMKTIPFYSALLLSLAWTEPNSITMNQALKLGLEQRADLAAQAALVQGNQAQIEQSQNDLLPQFSLSGKVEFNPDVQKTTIPSLGGQGGSQSIELGAHRGADLGLDANQVLYQPGLVDKIELARVEKSKSEAHLHLIQRQAQAEIANAYLGAQLAQERMIFAQRELKRQEDLLNVGQGKYQGGKILANEVLKLQLNRANAERKLHQSEVEQQIQLQKLALDLGEPEAQLQLADSLSMDHILAWFPASGSESIDQNPDLDEQKMTIRSKELELSINQKQILPTLSVFASYAQNYQGQDWSGNSNYWSPSSSVGIKLSLPLDQLYKNPAQNRINAQSLQAEKHKLLDQKQKIWSDHRQAILNVQKAKLSLQSSEASLKLAEQILITSTEQYNLGSASYSNLLEDQHALWDAQENYLGDLQSFGSAQIELLQKQGLI